MKEVLKKMKIPWSTKAAMEQVYQLKLWGGQKPDFYSGSGSHETEIVKPYITVVTSFLRSFKTPITVCDLGCGDFNVGKELVVYAKNYVAIDIVAPLIAFNKEKFKEPNLEFYCLDIAVADLPSGDCAIIRQVLQHLSNAEVQAIVNKLANFKYLILTEHLPKGDFIPNKDILSGQGIRLKKKSGINLLAPPFHLKVKEEKQMIAYSLEGNKGILVTTLYVLF
ncbi:MAG: SAM-dependent methyltransferase [Patiriisocius sp.]|jgi:SAM-dependent methyltransferase